MWCDSQRKVRGRRTGTDVPVICHLLLQGIEEVVRSNFDELYLGDLVLLRRPLRRLIATHNRSRRVRQGLRWRDHACHALRQCIWVLHPVRERSTRLSNRSLGLCQLSATRALALTRAMSVQLPHALQTSSGSRVTQSTREHCQAHQQQQKIYHNTALRCLIPSSELRTPSNAHEAQELRKTLR